MPSRDEAKPDQQDHAEMTELAGWNVSMASAQILASPDVLNDL